MLRRGWKLLIVFMIGLLITPGIAFGIPPGDRCSNYLLGDTIAEGTACELRTTIQGGGTVNPPEGSHWFETGSIIPITATPRCGWEFAKWVGDVEDPTSPQTTVVIDSHKIVAAVFVKTATPPSPPPPPPTGGGGLPGGFARGLRLNRSSLNLNTGYTRTLVPIFDPLNTTNKEVTWSSSNPVVAEVNEGFIRALAEGTTEITATTKDGRIVAESEITVVDPVVRIRLDHKDLTIDVGEKAQLSVAVFPEDATNKQVLWESTDPAVASVDSKGVVTGIAVGEATIIARSEAGQHIDTCSVRVKSPVTGVRLPDNPITLAVGGTRSLEAVIRPSDATDKALIWESSDERVVSVDERGFLTGYFPGDAEITVTTVDGGYQDTVQVFVLGEGGYPAITKVKVPNSHVNEIGQYITETDIATILFEVLHDRPVVTTVNGVDAVDRVKALLHSGVNVFTIISADNEYDTSIRRVLVMRKDTVAPRITGIEVLGPEGPMTANEQGNYVIETAEPVEVTVRVAAQDVNPMAVIINGQAVDPYEHRFTLAAGDNDVYIAAIDDSGNITTRELTITRLIPAVCPVQTDIPLTRDKTVFLEVEDSGVSVEVNPDVEGVDKDGNILRHLLRLTIETNDDERWKDTPLPEGLGIARRAYKITVDDYLENLITEFTKPVKYTFAYRNLRLAPDHVSIYYYDTDLEEWLELEEGKYGVSRIHNDVENGEIHVLSTKPGRFAILRDDKAPTQPILDSLPREIRERFVTVSGTAEPGSIVTAYIADTPAGTTTVNEDGSFSVEVELLGGRNPITAVACDEAGNASQTAEPQLINCLLGRVQIELTLNEYTGKVNGVEKELDSPPVLFGARTMVPYRFIGEGLGAYVIWLPRTRSVIVIDELQGITIEMQIGSDIALVNGEPVEMNEAPVIRFFRTLIPLRFVAEEMNCYVFYEDGEIKISR